MKKMKHKIHRSNSHVRKQREQELSNRKTRSSSKWSKTHDEDTEDAYSTAGKDIRFHEWWIILALKWLLKSLRARESRGRKHHLYSEWCWPDYQTNDKVFLVMSCSKRSLYLLDFCRLKSSSVSPCFYGNLPCNFCFNILFLLIPPFFPSPILGPYSSLSAIIFLLLLFCLNPSSH